MKRLFFISLLLLAFVETTIADVDTKTVEKCVDQLNCLVVLNSVENAIGKGNFPCDCSTFPDFNKVISKIPKDLTETLALTREINGLKSDIGTAWGKEEFFKFLTKDIFEKKAKYSKIYEFYNKRANSSEFKTWKDQLEFSLRGILGLEDNVSSAVDVFTDQQHMVSDSNPGASSFNETTKVNSTSKGFGDNDKSSDFFSFQINVIAVAFLLLLLFMFYRWWTEIEKFKEETLNSIKELKGNANSNVSTKSRDREGEFSSPNIKKLLSDINKLNQEVDLLKRKIEGSDLAISSSSEKTPDPIVIYTSSSSNNESKEVLFLSNPNSDGSFNQSSATNVYKEGATIYKFEVLNSQEAEFHICDVDSSMRMALQFPEDSILPVCESENEYDTRYNKVKTTKKGKVMLEGAKWILNKKATIRYEN